MKPNSNQQNPQLQKAVALHQSGKLNEAAILYKKLLQFLPKNTTILTNLGTITFEQGRLAEGVELLDKSLNLNPNQPIAYNNRGLALLKLRRLPDALASYDHAIALAPGYAEAFFNRGIVLKELGGLEPALANYDRAIALKPGYAEAYNNRGIVLRELNRLHDALASYEHAIAILPNHAYAYCNRGAILKQLNRLDEALASLNHAISLKLDYAEAYNNRGIVLKELNQLEAALASYNHAIALKPDYADAYMNKAHLHILKGEYELGWKFYEWRWKSSQQKYLRNFTQPLWLGEQAVQDKTILIHAEQGLGDVVQFCRYVLLLEKLGANVILEIPKSLVALLSTLKANFRIIEQGQQLPPFDMHCPIMSLPLAFKTSVETIPVSIPYLYAHEDKKEPWHSQLGTKTKPRIGLVWSGSVGHNNDHNRSLLLKQLLPLLELPFEFHSLQKEVREVDISTLNDCKHLHQHQDELRDFSDTAALMNEMDLIISVDTSVAHLAGALNKPLWILLPYMPDFRWMLERKDSPWYPKATLFRQPQLEDWESVIMEVTKQLLSRY